MKDRLSCQIKNFLKFSKNIIQFVPLPIILIFTTPLSGEGASHSSRHSSLAPTGGIARGLELLVWGCDYWKLHNEPTHLLPYNFFGYSRVELSSVWLYSLCGKWSRPTKWIQTQAPGCYSSMLQCSNHSAKLDIQYKHIQFIQVFHMLILSCLW